MTGNQHSLNFNNKPVRRRHVRPEQVNLSVERVEHLIIEVNNAAAVTQLIDGLERRLALVEDAIPAPNGAAGHTAWFNRVDEGNGAAHGIK